MSRSKQENRQIATIIAQQMGGIGPLKAMLGAKLMVTDSGLRIHFKGSRKANLCDIKLNGKDLYDMEFWLMPRAAGIAAGRVPKVVHTACDLYDDMIRAEFEEFTGLYCTL